MADTTPVSLLDRLREQPAQADWQRLVDLYTPLLRHWLSRWPSLRSDGDDLIQDILQCVVAKVPEFRRERTGSFRRWLRVVLANRVNLHWRRRHGKARVVGGDEGEQVLARLAEPDDPTGRMMEAEHNRYVVLRLTRLIESEFRPDTWAAFRRHVLDGLAPAAVAQELGISENAVLIARSRILKRLREEARGLLD